eukprot:scaffold44_cov339-Pavlova_lutheri.AAC.51
MPKRSWVASCPGGIRLDPRPSTFRVFSSAECVSMGIGGRRIHVPRLIPDTTRSNPDLERVSLWSPHTKVSSSSKRGEVSASMTVSAGLPHTLTAFLVPGTRVGATLILTAVHTPWELALASLSGAHTNTCI